MKGEILINERKNLSGLFSPLPLLVMAYGSFTLVSQVLEIREFFVVAGGNELLVGFFFFTWFLGVMIGAQVSSRFVDRLRSPFSMAVLFFNFQALLIPLNIFLIRCLRTMFHIPPGEIIPLSTFWVGTLLSLLPFSIFTGLNFPLLCHGLAQMGEKESLSIGRIYTADSVGSILGGLVFTFILIHIFRPLQAAFFISAMLLSAVLFATRGNRDIKKSLKIITAVLAMVFWMLWIAPAGRKIEQTAIRLRWKSFAPGFELLASTDTPYQNLSLAGRENQFSLLSNGKFVSSFPDPYATSEETHLIMTLCPEVQKILILGGGNPQILREILKYKPSHVDYVEADHKLLPFLEPYLPEEDRKSLKHPSVHIHHEDGRTFIRKRTDDVRKGQAPRYDLIWVDVPEPFTAESNRFYTVDLYAETTEILTHNGVLVTGCSSAVNYFVKPVSDYIQSIFKSLQAVFHNVKVTPGTYMHFLASSGTESLTLDVAVLSRRFEERKIDTPFFTPHFFESLLDPFQVDLTNRAVEKGLENAPLNWDLHPVTYLFNLRLWAMRSGSKIERLFHYIESLNILTAVGVLFCVFVPSLMYIAMKRKKTHAVRRFSILYLIAATGASGIAAEMILLSLYQNIYGSLYQRIGLFIACFMAGLTLGAHAVTSHLKRKEFEWSHVHKLLVILEIFYWLFYISLGVLTPLWIPGEGALFILVLTAGFLTGAAFPLAGKAYLLTGASVGRAAGKVEMADYMGAALGALMTGVIFVPALGIPQTLFLFALVKITSLTLLLFVNKLKFNT